MLNKIASIFSRLISKSKKTNTYADAAMNIQEKYAGKLKHILEDHYQVLIEKSLDAIYLHDFMGNFIDANPAALDLLGYSREEMPTLNFSNFLNEDQIQIALEKLKEIIITGTLQETTEYMLKHKNGRYLWIEAQATLIYSEGENGIIFGLARDISKRKEMEYALHKSEAKYRHMVENANDIIINADLHGRYKFMNQAGLNILGYTLEELQNISYWGDLVPKEHAEETANFYVNQFLEEVEETYLEYPMKKKDGTLIWLGHSVRVIKEGKNSGFFDVARDITDLRRSRMALEASEKKYRNILESLQEGFYEVDVKGKYVYVNNSMCSIFGNTKEEVLGKSYKECIGEASFEGIKEAFNEVYTTGIGVSFSDWELTCKNGKKVFVSISIDPVRGPDGKIAGFRGIASDITHQKMIEEALRTSEEEYRTLYDNAMAAMVTITVTDGKATSVNNLCCTMFGYSSKDEILNDADIVRKHIDPDTKVILLDKLKKDGEIYNHQVRLKRKDGSVFWGEVTARIDPKDDKIEWIIVDITKRKSAEEQIFDLTFYDQLTKLPNKEMFRVSLENEIFRSEKRKKDSLFAVICLGINRFKNINNLYDTDFGDLLLIEVAERLKTAVYENDTVSRFDGDKFMILFSDIASTDDAGDLVRKVNDIFSSTFHVNNEKLMISSSKGVCLYPKDGKTPELLIKNSEAAMYNAKEQGIDTIFFDDELNSRILYNFQLEKELRNAINKEEFIVHYQAKFKVVKDDNGDYHYNVDGMESLARWESSILGMIAPLHFIPLAEKNGMIVEIGYNILKKSCEQNMAWQKKGYEPVRVSVNLSPYQFSQADLIMHIEKIIQETGLDPKWLEFEITESGIMQDEKKNIEKIIRLRELGFSIAIDDFGTGQSSLSKLQNYPIDTLKIDKSFIDNIVTNDKTSSITKYIIKLAKDLGFDVVAEGVETKEQLDMLISHGCNMIQGFYFSKPLPSDEFEKKLN